MTSNRRLSEGKGYRYKKKMKMDAREIRTFMGQISNRRGNPHGGGTIESLLAPSEILTLMDRFPPKHIQFLLGLDINVVVNTTELH